MTYTETFENVKCFIDEEPLIQMHVYPNRSPTTVTLFLSVSPIGDGQTRAGFYSTLLILC